MAYYIQGNGVANATSNTLYKKTYSYDNIKGTIAEDRSVTGNNIKFNLKNSNLTDGIYSFLVKAKADGYTDSDYSNLISVVVDGSITAEINLLEPEAIIMGQRVNRTTGAIETTTGEGSGHIVYNNIDPTMNIYYSGYIPSSTGTTTCAAFYDASGAWISSVIDATNQGNYVRRKKLDIPSNCRTIRTQVYNYNVSHLFTLADEAENIVCATPDEFIEKTYHGQVNPNDVSQGYQQTASTGNSGLYVFNNIDTSKQWYATGYAPSWTSASKHGTPICYWDAEGNNIGHENADGSWGSSSEYKDKLLTIPQGTVKITGMRYGNADGSMIVPFQLYYFK